VGVIVHEEGVEREFGSEGEGCPRRTVDGGW